ncbi:hypothetical protein ACIGLI_08525 [Bacillus subtilis]|nr:MULTISPECIES: hypothetical protein [Bacillus]MDI6682840.1 hypothetical protein [Bacillus subtilis]MDQ4708299.1 hypothetical protein [Bacillus subtilis]MEC2266813.1 hypothetical protein [Bacillus subtilis]MED3672787.1 hypothetical protein [Bacillus subtilis]
MKVKEKRIVVNKFPSQPDEEDCRYLTLLGWGSGSFFLFLHTFR